jgi:EAL domain-containing protein (putative c-di-GMP-specific phosphodiesterase class I)/CheY-like chemotaxis protein
VEQTGATLLIVDDEAPLRAMFATGFRKSGYTVIEAATGSECLDAVSDSDVDLVLLDSGLPDIAGPDVVRTLRAERRYATLPIIMVTGHAEVSERVEGLRGGANDYVVKPVVFAELLARVEAALRDQGSWKARLSERIDVHGRLVADLARAADVTDGDGFSQLAQSVREALGFRRLVVAEQVGSGPIFVRAHVSANDLDRSGPDVIDDVHGLGAEVRRVVNTGASLLHAEQAAAVFGPVAGPSLLLTVPSGGDSVTALIGELDPATAADGTSVREAVASLTDLAPVVESSFTRRRGSTASVARREISGIIEERAFRPVFQPICRLDDGSVIGYELLTRFDDGVPPNVRFAQAAEVGIGAELELATLQIGLAAAAPLARDAMLSVNLSPSLIERPELRAYMGACRRPICIELTENEPITDYDRVLAAVAALPDHVSLSIDDAGSGWASLWHVHSLRPAYVKLDRSWVDGIHHDPARQILMRGLQLFVEEVGGRLIAEGIEDPADVDPLRSVGVTLGQGYLFGHPAPAEHWATTHVAPTV